MGLNLSDYQKKANEFAVANPERAVVEALLGLSEETGELLGKVKRVYRGDQTLDLSREAIAKELGDVLWYTARIATLFDLDFNSVALANIEKLEFRKANNTIRGNGDNR